MPVKLVVLGLLMEQPMHGYDIKHVIEEKISHIVEINFSSIYLVLNRFEKEGLITQKGVQKSGNRPPKKIYEITSLGKKEFLRLLKEDVMKLSKPKDPFYLYVPFMKHLNSSEVKASLEHRKIYFKKSLSCILAAQDTCKDDKFVKHLLQRLTTAYRSELNWLQMVEDSIK